MSTNLSALIKALCLVVWLLLVVSEAPSQNAVDLSLADWYESDASGLALRTISAALGRRAGWALAVVQLPTAALTTDYGSEIDLVVRSGGRVEYRILFANGDERRRTLVVTDQLGNDRLVDYREASGRSRWEFYDQAGLLTEEQFLDPEGMVSLIRYHYDLGLAIKVEGFTVEKTADGTNSLQPDWVELYKYNRDKSIRSMERNILRPTEPRVSSLVPPLDQASQLPEASSIAQAPTLAEDFDEITLDEAFSLEASSPPAMAKTSSDILDLEPSLVSLFEREATVEASLGVPRLLETRSLDDAVLRTSYDFLGRPVEIVKLSPEGGIIDSPIVYDYLSASELPSPGFSVSSDISKTETTRIEYDAAGKPLAILTTRGNETVAETIQDWQGDRIENIVWTVGSDTRKTEYYYNSAGERIAEKNYRNDVLERFWYIENSREVEELYRNGQLVLKAFWIDGVKVEEQTASQNLLPTGKID